MLAAKTTFRGGPPIDEWTIPCPECGRSVVIRHGEEAVACEHCLAAFAPEGLTTKAMKRAPEASAPSDPKDELVGQTLGTWQLTRLLGRGGMGRVYEAKGKRGRRVALKVLSEDLARDPAFVKRFRREARVLASLSHPHVVEILDGGETGGRIWFAMEYIRGENLRRRLERGPMDVEETVRIAREVASALAYAHARGIVHRDLKPENVLLDESGRVHLVDFGLSRLAGDGGAGATTMLTRTDVILGTYEYMAPEHRRGDKDIDGRADVFALGVILYEALTGQLPLGRFAPPSGLRSEVPAAFDAVVNRALATDRAARYADANAMRKALEEAWSGRNRKARAAPPLPPSKRTVRPPDRELIDEARAAELRTVLKHVDVLSALDRVLGILLILGSIGLLSLSKLLGEVWVFPVTGLVLFLFGIVFLHAGGKLKTMRKGSRDTQLTLSVLLLLLPPFLTVMGIYGLLVLSGDKARRAFALGRKGLEGPKPIVARRVVEIPRPVRKEAPWVLLRVLFLAALLWTLYAGFVALEGPSLPDDTLLHAIDAMGAKRLFALKVSAAGLIVAFVYTILAIGQHKVRRGLGLAITTLLLFAASAAVLSNAHRVHALATLTPPTTHSQLETRR